QRQKNLDIYVMSRHPLSGEVLTLSTPFGTSKALRATINVPQMTAPLVLYSIHTARPLPAVEAHMRNAQLQAMAAIIAADPSPFIILGGDLNITPWSPAFKNLLRGANMHYQTGGWLRHATWPSYLQVPLVQIPIDHLLPNNNLALATAQSGPYLKSDHRPYLATFTEK
ncbi:MAG: endonuclease/exonuclease/phosphatase family protein, partial [Alphaproteobacteria bacterium]|nr:endonuclease/exonuclease/phosphatase family protein [Alphaproteobacteria bacterium]